MLLQRPNFFAKTQLLQAVQSLLCLDVVKVLQLEYFTTDYKDSATVVFTSSYVLPNKTAIFPVFCQ